MSRLWLILRKSPPTIAAKWITWVGWYFSKSFLVSDGFLKMERKQVLLMTSTVLLNPVMDINYLRSPSLELRKMNCSLGLGSSSEIFLIACPTNPLPPVTRITFFSSAIEAIVILRSAESFDHKSVGSREESALSNVVFVDVDTS